MMSSWRRSFLVLIVREVRGKNSQQQNEGVHVGPESEMYASRTR
jgi:hypothetical protein